MIQITAQMRVLLAIEPVDGRKGIDSLARLRQEKLAKIRFPDAYSCFAAAVARPSDCWLTTARATGWRSVG
jgi:hypothetical protein